MPNPEYIWGYRLLVLLYIEISEPPMVGAEGTEIFDFGNPRLLEKTLSGTELHRKLLLHTTKY